MARARALLFRVSPWGPPLAAEEISRPRRTAVWVTGVLGACVALQVVLVFRFLGLGVFVPEEATEWSIQFLPQGFEAAAISAMGGLAKILGLIVAILAFVAVHAVAAAYRPRLMKAWGLGRLPTMGLYAVAPAAVILLVLFPLFGLGVAGAETSVGTVAAGSTTVLASSLYALVVDRSSASIARTHPEGIEISRRHFITASVAAIAFVAVGIAGLGAFVTSTGRRLVTTYRELLDGEVTPNDEFYTVQKNFVAPMVDPSTWQLTVGGLVATSRTYTSAELLQLSSREQYHTLICVSNEVGGGLIGNARWSGVPLRQVLEDAGVRPGATWVEFTCADGYTVGVPLSKALDDGAFLALFMNGERLPHDHGFPVRALIPGLYGMMNPKWINSISLVDREVVGYWQRQGWTNEGTIRLVTIISLVPTDAHEGVETTVGGVTFAGDRRITRVEVSDDGGVTWNLAEVKEPLSEFAWAIWRYSWTPPRTGRVRLVARAWELRDGVEVAQEEMRQSPYPAGATGYDGYDVDVAP